jgi:hypothetical protein
MVMFPITFQVTDTTVPAQEGRRECKRVQKVECGGGK